MPIWVALGEPNTFTYQYLFEAVHLSLTWTSYLDNRYSLFVANAPIDPEFVLKKVLLKQATKSPFPTWNKFTW